MSGTLNTFGNHAVACHGRGDASLRHDRSRDRIASACSAANLSPPIEKRNLIAENKSRQGDDSQPSGKSGQSAATLLLMRQRSQAMILKLQKIKNMLSMKIAVLNKEF